jgi:hypothetical protein
MDENMIKYPDIEVELTGNDPNAFSILTRVKRELRHHKVSKEECDRYMNEAMGGDYDHLIQVTMEWVTVL